MIRFNGAVMRKKLDFTVEFIKDCEKVNCKQNGKDTTGKQKQS
jgi:hypothetical protein